MKRYKETRLSEFFTKISKTTNLNNASAEPETAITAGPSAAASVEPIDSAATTDLAGDGIPGMVKSVMTVSTDKDNPTDFGFAEGAAANCPMSINFDISLNSIHRRSHSHGLLLHALIVEKQSHADYVVPNC